MINILVLDDDFQKTKNLFVDIYGKSIKNIAFTDNWRDCFVCLRANVYKVVFIRDYKLEELIANGYQVLLSHINIPIVLLALKNKPESLFPFSAVISEQIYSDSFNKQWLSLYFKELLRK